MAASGRGGAGEMAPGGPGGVKSGECDALIAADASFGQARRRVHPPRIHRPFGSGNEERTGLVDAVQAAVVEVSAIHHVEASGLDWQYIEDAHVRYSGRGDVNKNWNRAAQIEQRVQLNRRARATCGWRPAKQAQTKIDGC